MSKTQAPSKENGGEIGTWRQGVLRRRTTSNTVGDSLTKQCFKEQCDINRIVSKYEQTGLLEHLNQRPGFFEDLTNVPDYRSALNKVIQAKEAFGMLPARTRERFSNDPGEMLGFLEDPANKEEAIKLGLVKKPIEAPITPPPGA